MHTITNELASLRQIFVNRIPQSTPHFNVSAVCGPLVGGSLIAQIIASELDLEFFYTEKAASQQSNALYSVTYRIPSHLRTALEGKDVAIVDDVINAGSAIRGTLAEIQAYGKSPVVIGSLLILGETAQGLFTEMNLPLKSISYLPNKLWVPEECPFCAAETP